MSEKLSPESYEVMYEAMVNHARLTLLLFPEEKLTALLGQRAQVDAIVPLLDPTLYMMGRQKFQGVLELAKATLSYCRAIDGAFKTLEAGERKAQAYRDAGVGRGL